MSCLGNNCHLYDHLEANVDSSKPSIMNFDGFSQKRKWLFPTLDDFFFFNNKEYYGNNNLLVSVWSAV